MTESYLLRHKRLNALTTQIEAVEQRLLNRQQTVSVRTNLLVHKIHRQLTSPSALLMASSIGFIFGEFTKSCDSVDKSKSAEASALTTALNLVISLRTLYMALPVAWVMKAFKQRGQLSV
jgi:hypothetical protein